MTETGWKERARRFYDDEASGYEALAYGDGSGVYPANQIRLGHILDELRAAGSQKVFDLGCGSGYPLAAMLDAGFDAVGIDFSENMVTEARALLQRRGHDPERVVLGDGEDANAVPEGSFDAVIALGVFPHVLDEPAVIFHMARALRPGGKFIAEFRNALFSMFTLNEYSRAFYDEAFISSVGALPENSKLRAATDEYYRRAFGVLENDDEAEAGDDGGDLTYKSLVAKFHNPLAISELLEPVGLELDHRVYYHFHAAPPAVESVDPEEFRRISLEMEQRYCRDWRGTFLASAFVAVADKV